MAAIAVVFRYSFHFIIIFVFAYVHT